MAEFLPAGSWTYSDPTELSFDIDALNRAVAAIGTFGSTGAMVVHDGIVVVAMGNLIEKVLVRSVRKSLLSALIGIAVGRGQIDLDATLADLDIDDVEPLSYQEKQARVRHLLQARSGVFHPAIAETPEIIAAKPARGSGMPGGQWVYNNWDFNALGTIYERATGRSIYQGFMEDIAGPISMDDYRPEDGRYMTGVQSRHPAYHIALTARDMARFGTLYLNEGRWGKDQILPSGWVFESTLAYSQARDGGYGYMWWTSGRDGEAETVDGLRRNPDLPPFRYAAQGHHGQMIYVVPAKRLVLVTLSPSKTRTRDDWADYWTFVRSTILATPTSA